MKDEERHTYDFTVVIFGRITAESISEAESALRYFEADNKDIDVMSIDVDECYRTDGEDEEE